MSDDVWDVAVVGAGPAGAVAAHEAARLGVRVLLLDQSHFPRRKVCGCCLNRNALAALAAAGLGDLPSRLGAVPLTRVTLASNGRTASLTLPGGVSLSREVFDMALAEEARRAGVTVRTGVKITLEPAVDPAVRMLRVQSIVHPHTERADRPHEPIRTRVVIDATGLNGRLTDTEVSVRPGSRIGAGTVVADRTGYFQPGSIYMATGRCGYVGLVRLEDGRLDVAAAFDPGFVRDSGSLAHSATTTLREGGFPVPSELTHADWKGTPPLTRRPTRVAGQRWFAVGDAAGYVEPFTGEGMAWGISGAVALTPIVARAVARWDDQLVDEWCRVHRALVGRRQLSCRLVARVLRSPFACRLAVRGLQFIPGLAGPVVRALNRPSPALLRGR